MAIEDCIFAAVQSDQPQGTHQVKYLSFIQRKESSQGRTGYKCRLCNTTWMDESRMYQHCIEPSHMTLLKQLIYDQKILGEVGKRLKQCFKLRDRADELGLDRWVWEVTDLLFRYLAIDSLDDIDDAVFAYDEAVFYLEQNEMLERLSLVELAVWKAACIMDPPKPEMNLLE